MNEKETFKEKWDKADKKVIGALVVGVVIGAIFVRASVKVEIHAAGAEGYAKGAADVIRGIMRAED